MEVRMMKQNELAAVANFISTLNNMEDHHIGYCGKESDEIMEYIQNEIPYTESFITAFSGNQLIGVIGVDPDVDSGVAEVWGPFVFQEEWDVVDIMWREMLSTLSNNINRLYLFPNKRNDFVNTLAKKYDFVKRSSEAILVFNRRAKELLPTAQTIAELTPQYYESMMLLHDEIFPDTYYNGIQIIDRLNEYHKVFIINNDGKLEGYIYVEAEPKHGEGSIEFFGVRKDKRGKGIGKQLLTNALSWLFTFEDISSVNLCVDSSNENALHLYQKVGFQLQHDLNFYEMKINV